MVSNVALLTEGVDRNKTREQSSKVIYQVALLTEGVDRNIGQSPEDYTGFKSPSSRRAWIEIVVSVPCDRLFIVALLTEGVDRNVHFFCDIPCNICRPPHGGRG